MVAKKLEEIEEMVDEALAHKPKETKKAARRRGIGKRLEPNVRLKLTDIEVEDTGG